MLDKYEGGISRAADTAGLMFPGKHLTFCWPIKHPGFSVGILIQWAVPIFLA